MHSSHGVGEYSVTAVWPRAGGLSRRRPHEIVVVEQLYILYNILLLAEVTSPCAYGLSNMLTLAHFDALAFVKYRLLKTGPWPTTTPKLETFAKMEFDQQRWSPEIIA